MHLPVHVFQFSKQSFTWVCLSVTCTSCQGLSHSLLPVDLSVIIPTHSFDNKDSNNKLQVITGRLKHPCLLSEPVFTHGDCHCSLPVFPLHLASPAMCRDKRLLLCITATLNIQTLSAYIKTTPALSNACSKTTFQIHICPDKMCCNTDCSWCNKMHMIGDCFPIIHKSGAWRVQYDCHQSHSTESQALYNQPNNISLSININIKLKVISYSVSSIWCVRVLTSLAQLLNTTHNPIQSYTYIYKKYILSMVWLQLFSCNKVLIKRLI